MWFWQMRFFVMHHDCKIEMCTLFKLGVKKHDEYIAKDYSHLKNMKLYGLKDPSSI
jgi:hypothetical protein